MSIVSTHGSDDRGMVCEKSMLVRQSTHLEHENGMVMALDCKQQCHEVTIT